MVDALPEDMGTSGFSSPQATVYTGKGGDGGAFILGESQAANAYRDDVKGVLADIARQKAALNKGIADAYNVDTKGAWDVDIPELMQQKTKIRDRAAELMAKQARDKKYAGSVQYYQDINELNKMKDDVLMHAQQSAQHKVRYEKQLQDLVTDKRGLYNKPTSLQKLASYKGKGGVNDIMARSAQENDALLDVIPQFDFYKSAEAWKKNVGNSLIQSISGDLKTGKKNIMSDASGNLTDFGKKVEDNIDTYLSSPEGQKAVDSFATDYMSGQPKMARFDAEDIVRKQLRNSIDTEIKQYKHYNDNEGKSLQEEEKAGLWTTNTAYDYNSPDDKARKTTYPTSRSITPKSVQFSTSEEVLDHDTHLPVKGGATIMSGKVGNIVIKPVFDDKNKIVKYKAYVPVTAIDQGAFKDVKSYQKIKTMADEVLAKGVYPDGSSVGEDDTQEDVIKELLKSNADLLKDDKNIKIFKDLDVPYSQVSGALTGKGGVLPKTVYDMEKKVNNEFNLAKGSGDSSSKAKAFLISKGYSSDDASVKTFLKNNPNFGK